MKKVKWFKFFTEHYIVEKLLIIKEIIYLIELKKTKFILIKKIYLIKI